MGAGKSTHSAALAEETNAVRISEDEWLSALYPGLIETFDDYREYSSRLKPLVFTHVKNLLQAGTHVVLDFPANTPGQRAWFRELAEAAGVTGKLVYVRASDETCLAQIAKRRQQQPQRAQFDTEPVFRQVTRFFQEPEDQEGFDIDVIDAGEN